MTFIGYFENKLDPKIVYMMLMALSSVLVTITTLSGKAMASALDMDMDIQQAVVATTISSSKIPKIANSEIR